ncbi:MAG: hypothetical protein FGM61_06435 [Sediminibacterium sp.]|nr:hypothetical protein [Sediminibacterium sp.]
MKRLFPLLILLLPLSLFSQNKDREAAAADKARKKQEKKRKNQSTHQARRRGRIDLSEATCL